MDTITIILMIALVIAITVAVNEHSKAKLRKNGWQSACEESRKKSDALRLKGIEIDRLVKDLAKCQKED